MTKVSGSMLDEALHGSASQELQGRAKALAAEVESRIEVAETLATGLAQTLGGAVDEEMALDLERESAQGILSKALLANPNLLEVFTAWGEDAFDGFDAAYEGVDGYPAGGRMAVIARRDGKGQAFFSPVPGIESFAPGSPVEPGSHLESFLNAMEAKTAQRSNPVQLEDGEWAQLIAVPIVQGDEFFGVVGVTLRLSYAAEIANSGPGTSNASIMRLFGAGGSLVAQSEGQGEDPTDLFSALKANPDQQFQLGSETVATAPLSDHDNSMVLAVGLPTANVTAVSDAILREQFRAGALAICIALLATWLMARSIVKPLKKASHALGDIGEGEGDLTRRLVEQGTGESRELATGFNSFVAKLQALVGDVSGCSGQVGGAAQSLAAHSSQMKTMVNHASSQAITSAEGAHQIQSEVDSVSQAIGEMTESIAEIASNTTRASEIVASVVTTADSTGANLTQLSDVSQEIEDVIALISGIANQTNLLSLNASIEAARAGESGKGFSVVAGEVKVLASQTSDATSKIEQRIRAMQQCTKAVVGSVHEMSEQVGIVDDLTQAIAGAVVEQNAVARTIGESVSAAAEGCTAVASSVQEVANSVESASAGANAAEQETEALNSLSGQLNGLVSQFKV
ncbi:MAG: methyl-accepting chemotaxis protein [Planctomycetota bacterium]|nr:methyl-accepting chemotaxis protein [Planctomycetota bacterium]